MITFICPSCWHNECDGCYDPAKDPRAVAEQLLLVVAKDPRSYEPGTLEDVARRYVAAIDAWRASR